MRRLVSSLTGQRDPQPRNMRRRGGSNGTCITVEVLIEGVGRFVECWAYLLPDLGDVLDLYGLDERMLEHVDIESRP